MVCKKPELPLSTVVEKNGLKVYTSGFVNPSIFIRFTPELVSGFLDRSSVSVPYRIVLEIE